MKRLFNNPLLIKQLREEMRSKRLFILVPSYIGVLTVVALIAVGTNGGMDANPMALSGGARVALYSFVITITILLGLIATVLAAASFTVEREKATYELLELTPLTYAELVLGKFMHVFTITMMILISSLPVISSLFFMGGVTYADLFLTLFYLMVFFAVMILAALCISIISKRTILSIILVLAIGFVFAVLLSILSANGAQSPQSLGFSIISPWLVTWQQIFSPTPLKLLKHDLPVWPFYLAVYGLLSLMFLTWGRNALDIRKQERNIWARVLGLILVNGYVAVGLLCLRSYSPFTVKGLEDFFQGLMLVLLITLPFFAMGVFTDQDRLRFQKNPLVDTFRIPWLFHNYPATGPFYLILLVFTLSLTGGICSGLPLKLAMGYFGTLCLWLFPWLLIFTGMRLFSARPAALFVIYGIGTLLYSILAVFQSSGKNASSIISFYLVMPDIFVLAGIGVVFYGIARAVSRSRLKAREATHAV